MVFSSVDLSKPTLSIPTIPYLPAIAIKADPHRSYWLQNKKNQGQKNQGYLCPMNYFQLIYCYSPFLECFSSIPPTYHRYSKLMCRLQVCCRIDFCSPHYSGKKRDSILNHKEDFHSDQPKEQFLFAIHLKIQKYSIHLRNQAVVAIQVNQRLQPQQLLGFFFLPPISKPFEIFGCVGVPPISIEYVSVPIVVFLP